MRSWYVRALVATFIVTSPVCALAADPPAPTLKEASLVTEVLAWGETVMAVRLEYTDDIAASELTAQMPTQSSDSSLVKFRLFANRAITVAYVNDSGKKDDVATHGRFVFLDLGLENLDATTYRSQVTFNPVTKNRPRLAGFVVSQTHPITTRSGKVINPVTMSTTREIAVGIDDYTTTTFTNAATGHTLNYHLYVPAGFQAKRTDGKRLPLVVHFPSGDFNYADWTGKARGALFTHHDALYWSDDASQAAHPAFVVTVGGLADPKWSTTEFSESEMQQNYVAIVKKIAAEHDVDPRRIYAVSLAGGSVPMWSTILANPTLFAAQISTAYDPYHAWKDVKTGEAQFGRLLEAMPGWFFAGLTDPTGAGALGAADTRFKGERLRDIATVANAAGAHIDVAYGTDGELMWNGLLRGELATRLAEAQLARAKAAKATHLVTLYIPGTILVNQHWCWDATYANAGVRDWLFQQVRAAK